MLSRLLHRWGVAGTTIVITAASVVLSEVVTIVIMTLWLGGTNLMALTLSAAVPALCAPVFTVVQLRLVAQLDAAREELRRLSVTDELTGAHNRRFFMHRAADEVARARRYGTALSVLLFDLDGFKSLNDRYGHACGDAVLRAIAETGAAGRISDLFARLGGEEFGLLLPNTSEVGAVEVAERLRERIAGMRISWHGAQVGCTASFGLAVLGPEEAHIEQVLRRADRALYQAKADGRNVTRVAGVETADASRRSMPVTVPMHG